MTAKCDSHPQGGDASAAPFMTSAVPEGHSPESRLGDAEQVREAAAKDNCELCLGAKGGVPGNENRILGLVVCDYCHGALAPGLAALPKAEDKTTLPDDGLRKALERIAAGTPDKAPPFRAMPADEARRIAVAALKHEGGSGDVVRELLEDARDSLKDMTDLVNSIGEDEDIGLPPPQWQRLEDATDTFNRIDAALSVGGDV
jgi:hypothetical protein